MGEVARGAPRARAPTHGEAVAAARQLGCFGIPRRDRGKSTTRNFVSFPPGPAVLMMPFVAAVGYGANDVLFTIIGLSLIEKYYKNKKQFFVSSLLWALFCFLVLFFSEFIRFISSNILTMPCKIC